MNMFERIENKLRDDAARQENLAAVAAAVDARHGIGGNNPPLEERVLLDLESALLEHDGLIARIAQFEAKANEVAAEAATLEVDGDKLGPCKTADMAGRYGDFIKMTSAAVKVIEAERETINRPLLTAQRSLKARADSYSQRAQAAGDKVRMQLNKFLAEEDRRQRAEAARLAEIARQAEIERQVKIDEANRIAREEAEAERARLQAIEDERAAVEKREAEAVVVKPEPVYAPEPEPVFVSAAAPRAPVRGDYGTAVSTVETWHVEITNIRQVPDMFLKNGAVVEALRKVIAPLVSSKTGLREIKGCRVYSTIGSSVR